MEKQRMILRCRGEFVSCWTDVGILSAEVLASIYPDANVLVSKPDNNDPCGHMYSSVAVIDYR